MNPSDSVRWIGAAPTWLSQTPVSGYGSAASTLTVVADTGQLAYGFYDLHLFWGSGGAVAPGEYQFEWRNAANTGNLWAIYLYLPAADIKTGIIWGLQVLVNQRFRFYKVGATASEVYGGLIAIQRA
jgi:hypothetical protein